MDISIPMNDETQLFIHDHVKRDNPFPTSQIQKGFLLFHRGKDLSAEAVGFGVPVIKCGLHTIFPGEVKLSETRPAGEYQVDALYSLNLEEKTVGENNGKTISGFLNQGKLWLSAFIRRLPWSRKPLMHLSKLLRFTFHWQTEYLDSEMRFRIPIQYKFHKNTMAVIVDLSQVKDDRITEIVIMNEQGAKYFNHYRDSDGKEIQGNEIGCWDEVKAPEATFVDPQRKISFSLKQVPGAKLFRGLEMADSRLAWSGFGYTFSPRRKKIRYTLKIGKI